MTVHARTLRAAVPDAASISGAAAGPANTMTGTAVNKAIEVMNVFKSFLLNF
jgi:hypothetical protein